MPDTINCTVRSILTNEKYKGDALLQKVYTADFLTKEKKKNNGEVPQYYVEKNHEAIIDLVFLNRCRRRWNAAPVQKGGTAAQAFLHRKSSAETAAAGSALRCGIPTTSTAG